ncbi:MAG: hypothetical protein WD737_10710 [Gemmatimonadota bacterium]
MRCTCRRLVFVVGGIAAVLGASCSVQEGLLLTPRTPAPEGWSWHPCPSSDLQIIQVDTTIGPQGGTVRHPSGHSILVPEGAVSEDHVFVLIVPPSPHLEVIAQVRPSVEFPEPVMLTMSVAGRCTFPEDSLTARVFRVNRDGAHDDVGGEVTQDRTAIAVPLNRLSNYALATNRQ